MSPQRLTVGTHVACVYVAKSRKNLRRPPGNLNHVPGPCLLKPVTTGLTPDTLPFLSRSVGEMLPMDDSVRVDKDQVCDRFFWSLVYGLCTATSLHALIVLRLDHLLWRDLSDI